MEVLAAGAFSILEDYDSFYRFYYYSFIGIYSDHCSGFIKDPVGREIKTIRKRVDSSGTVIDEENFGPPRKILIEREYANAFDQYYGPVQRWANMKVLGLMASGQQQSPFLNAQVTAGFFMDNHSKLEEHIQGNCTDDLVQTIYTNMYNYTYGQPPIVGKYTTLKEPYEKIPAKVSSAPAESKRIADEQARWDAERAEARRQIEAERTAYRPASMAPTARPSTTTSVPTQTPTGARGQQQVTLDHQARQKEIARLSRDHQEEMAARMTAFQNKMRSAQSEEERAAILQEMQTQQLAATQELQKKLMELRQN